MIKFKIEKLDAEGRGVANFLGKRWLIFGALPGEKYQSLISESSLRLKIRPELKSSEVKALLTSPQRVEPACGYFGVCGGCQLQHLNLASQLELKRQWLVESLKKWLSEEKIPPLIPSPQTWNYRRRVQWQVSPRGELGFFAAHRHQVVPVDSCPLVDEEILTRLPEVKAQAALALQGRHQTLLSFETTREEDGRITISSGSEPRSFIQNNAGANQQLLDFLESKFQANPPLRVLELFAGSGNFSFVLAKYASDWTAVEANAASIAQAQENDAMRNLLIQWIRGDAEQVLKKLQSQGKTYDVILLDPPRQGAEACLRFFSVLEASQIYYLSCSLSALRRDLEFLGSKNYRVESVQAFDFFPQTVHLETLVHLVKDK